MLNFMKTHMVLPFSIFIVLCLFPLAIKSSYILILIIMTLIWAICAMCFDVTYGYMGVFHFAQISFLGIGGYASSLICMNLSVSPWVSMLLGGIAAGMFSLPISLTSLRLKGAVMVLVSFVFALMLFHIAYNWTDFTKGEWGITGIPPLFRGISILYYYYVAVGLFTFTLFVLNSIVKSRYGLALTAIKKSEDSARCLGIEVAKIKLLFFTVCAIFTGVAGGFYAHYILLVTPELLSLDYMIMVVAMTITGGTGTLYGPVLGSFLIMSLLEYFRFVGAYRLIIYSFMLILIMIFRPRGLYGVVVSLSRLIKSKLVKGSWHLFASEGDLSGHEK